jgi:hypothetical protein
MIRCQFCGELKRYPGEITQESAHEVTKSFKKWIEWTSLWRCKRCAERGLATYIEVEEDGKRFNKPWHEANRLIEKKGYKEVGWFRRKGTTYITLAKPGKERVWRIPELRTFSHKTVVAQSVAKILDEDGLHDLVDAEEERS